MANFFQNLDKEKPPNIPIAKSANGWTDDELGMEWLQRIYEPYSRKLILLLRNDFAYSTATLM